MKTLHAHKQINKAKLKGEILLLLLPPLSSKQYKHTTSLAKPHNA